MISNSGVMKGYSAYQDIYPKFTLSFILVMSQFLNRRKVSRNLSSIHYPCIIYAIDDSQSKPGQVAGWQVIESRILDADIDSRFGMPYETD
jgi:hypothetical protein